MRRNSLAFRLFIAAAAWSLLVLPITAIILVSVYRGTVERSFDARLNVYLTALVAIAAGRADLTSNPPNLADPNFRLPFSGWYWQFASMGSGNSIVLTSESLLDQRLTFPPTSGSAVPGPVQGAYTAGPEGQTLRILQREITLQRAGLSQSPIRVSVAGDATEISETVGNFRTLLIIALSILGVGLLVATFFQVRFGLLPLQAIGRDLSAIRSGEAERLESELPIEVVPLQTELNALIESNRAIVERARTHVGNLAHALKTPLSVITNEAGRGRGALARKVREQAGIMRNQIDHHLNRASIAARSGITAGNTRVRPVLDGLVRTLEKIHADRGMTIDLKCDDTIVFRGEKHDLEEMAGNLLDNACKWAQSRITVSVAANSDGFRLIVEDDGTGLSKQEREDAVKRGRRLDETKSGSGLGLSIVADLADMYNGHLVLKNSATGGLRAVLDLPRA